MATSNDDTATSDKTEINRYTWFIDGKPDKHGRLSIGSVPFVSIAGLLKPHPTRTINMRFSLRRGANLIAVERPNVKKDQPFDFYFEMYLDGEGDDIADRTMKYDDSKNWAVGNAVFDETKKEFTLETHLPELAAKPGSYRIRLRRAINDLVPDVRDEDLLYTDAWFEVTA